jgi:hypothetical protein
MWSYGIGFLVYALFARRWWDEDSSLPAVAPFPEAFPSWPDFPASSLAFYYKAGRFQLAASSLPGYSFSSFSR